MFDQPRVIKTAANFKVRTMQSPANSNKRYIHTAKPNFRPFASSEK